jgi:hypothetical protein
MQWISSTRPGQRFHRGQGAWTSACLSRSGNVRWLGRPFDGFLTRPCPLGELCTARKARFMLEGAAILEPDRESDGSLAPWPGVEPAEEP